MIANQPAIEDKATGTQHHPAPGADQQRLAVITLKRTELLPQAVAITGGEVLQALGPRRQALMQEGFAAARRQAPEFGTHHPAAVIHHQAPRR